MVMGNEDVVVRELCEAVNKAQGQSPQLRVTEKAVTTPVRSYHKRAEVAINSSIPLPQSNHFHTYSC